MALASRLITIDEALEHVLGAAAAVRLPTERVAIGDALDRVLAEDLTAAGDVPPFACSAMDGYAIVAGAAGRRLTVAGESRAGTPAATALSGPAEAFRISTGAAAPAGADAVIRQEDTEPAGAAIVTLSGTALGENLRGAGEDLVAGATVLHRGTRFGVAELGAAVGAGAGTVTVASRPRVAVLCTGDELRAPGEALGPGEIHNSNAVMLSALAVRAGALAVAADRIPDNRDETERVLARGLDASDVVVISGGVSVGPHDHVKPALEALGAAERFWGVALQPGKPTWFGVHGDTLVFGLPGNPVSAVVTFVLFVAPALRALAGESPAAPGSSTGSLRAATATLGEPVSRNRQREQAVRVRLEQRDGTTIAIPTGPQGSHVTTSLLGADALALIPAGEGAMQAGARVALVPMPR
jgi:molybdopterin molybdotransferase